MKCDVCDTFVLLFGMSAQQQQQIFQPEVPYRYNALAQYISTPAQPVPVAAAAAGVVASATSGISSASAEGFAKFLMASKAVAQGQSPAYPKVSFGPGAENVKHPKPTTTRGKKPADMETAEQRSARPLKAKEVKDPEADDEGIREAAALANQETVAQLKRRRQETAMMLIRMGKDPDLKKELTEAGIIGEFVPAKIHKLTLTQLDELIELADVALGVSLNPGPVVEIMAHVARGAEAISMYAFHKYGTVPLTGLESDIRENVDLRKTIKKYAYTNRMFSSMSSGWSLAWQIPTMLMERYSKNSVGYEQSTKAIQVPQGFIDEFADL